MICYLEGAYSLAWDLLGQSHLNQNRRLELALPLFRKTDRLQPEPGARHIKILLQRPLSAGQEPL